MRLKRLRVMAMTVVVMQECWMEFAKKTRKHQNSRASEIPPAPNTASLDSKIWQRERQHILKDLRPSPRRSKTLNPKLGIMNSTQHVHDCASQMTASLGFRSLWRRSCVIEGFSVQGDTGFEDWKMLMAAGGVRSQRDEMKAAAFFRTEGFEATSSQPEVYAKTLLSSCRPPSEGRVSACHAPKLCMFDFYLKS